MIKFKTTLTLLKTRRTGFLPFLDSTHLFLEENGWTLIIALNRMKYVQLVHVVPMHFMYIKHLTSALQNRSQFIPKVYLR